MRTKAEIGGRNLQAKKHQGLPAVPEAKGNETDSPLETSEKSWLCQHLNFRLNVASETVKE